MSTLYSNERVPLWNPEHDQYELLKLAEEEAAIQQAIEEGHALDILRQSTGFKILEDFLKNSIDNLVGQLKIEQDYKKIRRLQEALKAYHNVLLFVDVKVNDGKALQDQQRTPSGANPKE